MKQSTNPARSLAILGAVLILLGLLTGIAAGQLPNPRMGLSSHLAAMMGGGLLLALAGAWPHVHLPPRAENAAVWLLSYGNLANWLATLLAAVWGAGAMTMPIASGGRSALPWQEGVVTFLLYSLSLATIAGMGLVLWGLVRGKRD